jgi:hypothetical protein
MWILRCFWVLLSVMALASAAQDSSALSDDEALSAGGFDRAIAAGAAADSTNKLEYLKGVFFVSEASGNRTFKSGDQGSDARFYGKAFVKASKADIGALFLGYNFNYFIFASAGGEPYRTVYRLQSPDPSGLKAALSEFHLSFDVKKKVFVRAGSQLISWGATYFWTPVDFINRQKALASVISVVDVRAGKPGVRVHVPMNSMNVFLFTDFSGVTAKGTAGDMADAAQAWRVDGTFGGVQLGTVGYIAKNSPTHIGFDATGRKFGTDLYGECALTFTNDLRSTPDIALCAGGAKQFGSERNWTARAEIYYNETGYQDVALSKLPPGAFAQFYSGKYYCYGEVTGVNLLKSMLAISAFGYGNVGDGSFSTTLQLTLDLPGVLPFTVFGRYFGGQKDREFTSLTGGQALGGGVRIRADF